MCDYSLGRFKSRPAVVGELLVSSCPDYYTAGLFSRYDAETAVCLQPGTRVMLEGFGPKAERALGVLDGVLATFEQRDGSQYSDGFAIDGASDGFIFLIDLVDLVDELYVYVESIPGELGIPIPAAFMAMEEA